MIITYTTKHFDPVHPDSELIDIEDIAHALSQICRGYGSTKAFWSVAEHSISSAKEAAARHLSNKVILACLLNHAANAYLPEIPESVKQECPRYTILENNIRNMIIEKFLDSSLTEEERKAIKEIDETMQWHETDKLVEDQGWVSPPVHIGLDFTVRPFKQVEKEFLDLYYQYSGEEQPKFVYLEDIASAMEGSFSEWHDYYNKNTGEIVSIPEDLYLVDDREEMEALIEEIDENDYYVRLPDQYELNEKRIMGDFAGSVTDKKRANRLFYALNGRHPYRYFKDAINELGIAKQYYDFRMEAYIRKAEEWCRENKIRYWRKT